MCSAACPRVRWFSPNSFWPNNPSSSSRLPHWVIQISIIRIHKSEFKTVNHWKCNWNKRTWRDLSTVSIDYYFLKASWIWDCLPTAAILERPLLHGPRTSATRARVEGLVDEEIAISTEEARAEWTLEALGFGRRRELAYAAKTRRHCRRWILPQFTHKNLKKYVQEWVIYDKNDI